MEDQGNGNTGDMPPPPNITDFAAAKKEKIQRDMSPFMAACQRIGQTEDGRIIAAALRKKLLTPAVRTQFSPQGYVNVLPADRELLLIEGEKLAILGILTAGLDPQIQKDLGV